MNKISKYNQILFSIIGSVVIIMMLVGGIKLLADFFRVTTYNDNTLIVKEELDSLKQLNLRNQIISLEEIHEFDSLTKTYIVPVYHRQLENATSRNNKVFNLIDLEASSSNEYYGYGNYNNLILYNFSTGDSRVLLDTRMNIDRYNTFRSKHRSLIVFTGWDQDTNKDGKLGDEDFKKAYVYDHKSTKLRQVGNSNYRILNFQYLEQVDKLIFNVTDIRNDTIPEYERPGFLANYSFEKNKLEPLIDIPTLNKIQDIIDN